MRTTYLYRVNFGNGQVYDPAPATKRACFQFIAAHGDGYSYVEFQDPDTGDWFATGNNHKTRDVS